MPLLGRELREFDGLRMVRMPSRESIGGIFKHRRKPLLTIYNLPDAPAGRHVDGVPDVDGRYRLLLVNGVDEVRLLRSRPDDAPLIPGPQIQLVPAAPD